ncbi:MAG TPA: acyl-CoA dehydrogenase family protein [Candidatus Baltobacteraceae bacterium]|nr:acyl-CoA dehydrogenase family protein [Candidatus Baltobacteraceae bacterium]
MPDTTFLSWPFFDETHRALAPALDAWAARTLSPGEADDVEEACRALVRDLGRDGWLRYAVPAAYGGAFDQVDSRAVCLVRETLARHDALADFAFAMQGLGGAPIVIAGDAALRQRYLPRICSGDAIAAFALSERDAGSDVAAIATSAERDGDAYVLDGEKTWISNGGIADVYVVFARTGEAAGSRGLSAFVVEAETPGFTIAERIELIAPHPLATLRFERCRVPATQRLGVGGDGFAIAMRALDVFRASVAAAALGIARRAFDEALAHARRRTMFGTTLASFQLTQAALAEMATAIDAAALLTYRAAWSRDVLGVRTTREAAMAKLTATESAQRVVDRTVQLFGALGLTRGSVPERLYREIRALRIYEGASEVQQLVIARQVLG